MATQSLSPIDYLAVGHIACDLTPSGNQLGGTIAYASLTAHALGQRTGIITAAGEEVSLIPINPILRAGIDVRQSTTFENRTTSTGRTQILHHHAPMLHPDMIPAPWRDTALVHLGPIVHEINPELLDCFPNSFIGLTPQGWLRQWDDTGRITPGEWPEYAEVLSKADAAVLSLEDVGGDETRIEKMAECIPILVVTEGERGARLFLEGIATRIHTHPIPEADATGAGDIFAAVFFIHLHRTSDPFEAARFATYLAAHSVTRPGLDGIPDLGEIHAYKTFEVLQPG
jgi:sugar/nucleoside kinase (ribokinase family)